MRAEAANIGRRFHHFFSPHAWSNSQPIWRPLKQLGTSTHDHFPVIWMDWTSYERRTRYDDIGLYCNRCSFVCSQWFFRERKSEHDMAEKRGRETDREISVPYLFFEPALIPLFRLIRHLKWRVEKTPFFSCSFFLTKWRYTRFNWPSTISCDFNFQMDRVLILFHYGLNSSV